MRQGSEFPVASPVSRSSATAPSRSRRILRSFRLWAFASVLAAQFFLPGLLAGEEKECIESYLLARFLGHSDGKYWVAVEAKTPRNTDYIRRRGNLPRRIRIWSFDEADCRNGRISKHQEYLTGVVSRKWCSGDATFLSVGEDYKIRTFDFATAETKVGVNATPWNLPGAGGMIAVRSVDGFDIILCDGTVVYSAPCQFIQNTVPPDGYDYRDYAISPAKGIFWAAPKVFGMMDGKTDVLTVVGLPGKETREYHGVDGASALPDNVIRLHYSSTDEGRALQDRLGTEFVAFDGLDAVPAYDSTQYCSDAHYGLREADRGKSDPVVSLYTRSGKLAFEFWTGFINGTAIAREIDWPDLKIGILGDTILRLDGSDYSLVFYDSKTSRTADGTPFASLLCHSTDRIGHRSFSFFADGSFVQNRDDNPRTSISNVPMSRTGPWHWICLPDSGGPDDYLLYGWSGERFFRIKSSGDVEISKVAPPVPATIIFNPDGAFTAIGLPNWLRGDPDTLRQFEFSIYANDSLFSAAPVSLAQVTVNCKSDIDLGRRLRFLGATGWFDALGKLVPYVENPAKINPLVEGQDEICAISGDIAIVTRVAFVEVDKGRGWKETVQKRRALVYDFLKGRSVVESEEDIFKLVPAEVYRFASLPGVVFVRGDGNQLVAFPERWREGHSLCAKLVCPANSVAFFFDNGIQCLSASGSVISTIAIPDAVKAFSAAWVAPDPPATPAQGNNAGIPAFRNLWRELTNAPR